LQHTINLEMIIKEIENSNRPACHWATKDEIIQILKENAMPLQMNKLPQR